MSAFFERGGSLWAQISGRKSITHQPLSVSENLCDCPFVWCQNIRSAAFNFVTMHVCDRQTDRITTPKQTAVA